jgi:flagella basal body P-ring formation protein FlgA
MIVRKLKIVFYIALLAFAHNANASISVKTEHSIFANISIVDTDKVKDIIFDSLMDELQSDKLSIKIRGYEKGIKLNSKHESFDVDIVESSFNKRSRRFKYKLSFAYGDRKELRDLAGSFEEIVSIPVLSSRIPHNTIITSADIDYMEIARHKIRHDTITSEEDLIGKTLKHAQSPMRPVRNRDVAKKIIVSRTNNINILYKTPSMTLTAAGIAMDGGAEGDLIRIRNKNSNKVVQAVIKSSTLAVISSENL